MTYTTVLIFNRNKDSDVTGEEGTDFEKFNKTLKNLDLWPPFLKG